MAKQTKKQTTKKQSPKKEETTMQFINKDDIFSQVENTLPEDAKKGFKDIRKALEDFQENLWKEPHDLIKGLALLPPTKNKDDKGNETVDKETINVLVLLDDTDKDKAQEAYNKEPKRIEAIAKKTSKRLSPKIVYVNQLWTEFSDGKYDWAQEISLSLPYYDTGYLSAVKIGEVHKNMVIKKFEKYIVSYVMAGSLIQGRATSKSDIDVYIVIDDTDVKRMSRAELKDKLRAIIIGMGIEAGELTGIKNKLHVQIYILTDFWHSIREANPVIFTFIRDGVPLYDRGIYTPWKLLLKQGRIKPSQEAIDLYMNSGKQVIQRSKAKLKEIGMEDTYYALLTPSQAALMLYGLTPATAKETAELMRKIFVKEEKILEDEYVKVLEDNIKIRKGLEHGDIKELTGKEVDKMIMDTEKFLNRIEKLFEEIEKQKSKESIEQLTRELTELLEALITKKTGKKPKTTISKEFEEHFVKEKMVHPETIKKYNDITSAKEKYEKGKLKRTELEIARREGTMLLRSLAELYQRLELKEHDTYRLRIIGEKGTEYYHIDNSIYTVRKDDGTVTLYEIKENGSISSPKDSTIEQLKKRMETSIPRNSTIDIKIIRAIEKETGEKILLVQ
ncbi:MAG: hypothetical protein ACMXYL_05510 [Candidatus Woesearchaeota archaeon]